MLDQKFIQISVIIVNYNTYNLTYECIKSIIEYTSCITYEIIVIDNNSTENCSMLKTVFPDIKLIYNDKKLWIR